MHTWGSMTEYEAYDTLMSIAAQSYQLLFGFFSLVFAFLVMSHMAARKLSGRLSVVVLTLYSIACLIIVLNFYALNVDLDSLYSFMLAQKQNGTYDLSWFGLNPPLVPRSLSVLTLLLGVGGYFGSIYFFLHSKQRRVTG